MKRGLVFLALAMPFLGGCKTMNDDARLAGYKRALDETDPKRVGYFAPGSAEEAKAIKSFTDFFTVLSEDGVRSKAAKVYAKDAYFNDTLRELHGSAAIEPYLMRSAQAVDSCTVDIIDVTSNKGEYYFRWVMKINFKRFKRGETQTSIGITHIRFNKDGQVAFHQDYWDAAAGLFEKIPVLGSAIRGIKSRL